MTEPVESTDWLDQLRRSGSEALAALFRAYEPRLANMISLRLGLRLGARVDASDVLQEAFIDAAQQLDAYLRCPKVTPFVWLRSVTHQRLIKVQHRHANSQRRNVNRETPLPTNSSTNFASRFAASGTTPTQAARRNELTEQVHRALACLSDQDREVILMRDFEGMSNAEVAQVLEVSDSGATMRYGRAICRLREVLESEVPEGDLPK